MTEMSLSATRRMLAGRLAEGDVDGALQLGRRLAAQFPRDRQTSLLVGRAHLARGDAGAARTELEPAAAALPDNREVWLALTDAGSDAARTLLADLPPLPVSNGERPPITAAALGHLYLRQNLFTHCTAQLDPVWRGDTTRLDVGVALAEAHWRLGETDLAEEICRTVLRSSPDCLKANLILAQQLWVEGRREEASVHLDAARAVDPENETAEELYEWLTVTDAGLVPLRGETVSVDLEAALAAIPETPAGEAPGAEPVMGQGLGGIEGILGGIPAPAEPIAEPEPFWERPAEAEEHEQPAEAAAGAEPARGAAMAGVAAEPAGTAELPPSLEAAAEAPAEQWLAYQEARSPVPEVAEEASAPALEGTVEARPARAPEAAEAAAAPAAATPAPAGVAEAAIASEAALAAAAAAPEPAAMEAAPTPAPEPAAVEAAATPAPEPVVETVPVSEDWTEPLRVRWLEVTGRGQLVELREPARGAARDLEQWAAVCRRLSEVLQVGALRASSLDSAHGAMQMLHEPGACTAALAPAGTNLGLVRATLRRTHNSLEERNPS